MRPWKKKFLFGILVVHLTSLHTEDTEESIGEE